MVDPRLLQLSRLDARAQQAALLGLSGLGAFQSLQVPGTASNAANIQNPFRRPATLIAAIIFISIASGFYLINGIIILAVGRVLGTLTIPADLSVMYYIIGAIAIIIGVAALAFGIVMFFRSRIGYIGSIILAGINAVFAIFLTSLGALAKATETTIIGVLGLAIAIVIILLLILTPTRRYFDEIELQAQGFGFGPFAAPAFR